MDEQTTTPTRTTFRKLARELVIFVLLGPVVVLPIMFGFVRHDDRSQILGDAARGVYAVDSNVDDSNSPDSFIPDNSVAVPLSNGRKLWVKDCAQLHPWITVDEPPGSKPVPPILKSVTTPPGSTNGSDCLYFVSDAQKYQGHLESVGLGEINQVAIEQKYWQSYERARREHIWSEVIVAGVFSLWGFPAGIVAWALYRLIRFAIQG